MGRDELAAHIVVLGTFLPNTIRCDAGYSYRRPDYLGPEHGGMDYSWSWEDSSLMHCFSDVRVDEYIVGSGPSVLTTQVLFDFLLPSDGGAETLALLESLWEQALSAGGNTISQEQANNPLLHSYNPAFLESVAISGIEGVIFLGPLWDASVGAWAFVNWWGIERGDEGIVKVIHPERNHFAAMGEYATEIELTVPAFKQAATAANTARVAANGGRTRPKPGYPMLVTNANNLRTFFVEIGAYDDPANPPEQPPAAYSCDNTTTVSSPGRDRGLVRDCEALLLAKDRLRGTTSLNWSASTAVTGWEGVTISGTPGRIAKVELPNESLNGAIPASLGNLFNLTHLDLSGNSFTSSIPRELVNLDNLQVLRLSGNSLTGCIPEGLKDVATNDLGSLNLLDCPPAPSNPSVGTPGEASVPVTWSAVSNASKYRVEYRQGEDFEWPLDLLDDWTLGDEVPTGTSHTVTGLVCDQKYRIRVRAYGNGTNHAAEWGDPSESATTKTAACVPPTLGRASYSFSVRYDAETGRVVGSVSATGSAGADDTVTYAITEGNEDGKFALDESTGEITVAAALTGLVGTTHTLTVEVEVEVEDESGGATTVTVTVRVPKNCSSGTAVSNPTSNTGLVSDCKTLLGLKDELAGTGSLNWSGDLAMSDWSGISIGDAPRRVIGVKLNNSSLGGVIPAALGDLAKLQDLWLGGNQLTGEIPPELGNLTSLYALYLDQNRLTGEIPAELGNLSALEGLFLYNNQLTGSIPPEVAGHPTFR